MAINDPRDIPGLVAWFSAEAEAYGNDAEMGTWSDLSGLGNHATGGTTSVSGTVLKPLWQATSGPAGGPAVRFGAGGGSTGASGAYFTLPAAILTGAAAGEVMATVRSEFDNTTQVGNWIKTGAYNGGTHYPYQTTIYDDFGSTTRKTVGTPGSLGSWHRANAWSAAGDYGYRLDGASVFTTTSNTVGWASLPRIGNSGPAGATSNQTVDTWEGHIGCLLLFSRKLSTTERADLDAWLQAHPSGGTTGPQTPVINLNGVAPQVAGAFDVTVTPSVSITATAPSVTGAFDFSVVVPQVDVDLAGGTPAVTGSFNVAQTGVGIVDLTGTAPGVFGTFGVTASGPAIEVATDSVDRGNGMTLVTEWLVEVTPQATQPKRQRGHDYATATSISSPTFVDGRPT